MTDETDENNENDENDETDETVHTVEYIVFYYIVLREFSHLCFLTYCNEASVDTIYNG